MRERLSRVDWRRDGMGEERGEGKRIRREGGEGYG